MMFRVLLNVLSLLKKEPKTFDEMWITGLFPKWVDFEYQLAELEKAQIIRQDEKQVYHLAELGTKLLESYPNIRLKEVDLVYNPETRSYIKLVQPSFPR
jgi:predicted transcriptional regulator